MYYLTSLVLSTAALSLLLETNTRLSMSLLSQLLTFSKRAVQYQVYCSTKPFRCRFSSLKSSTSLERFVFGTYFFLSNCMRNYKTIFHPISHAFFFYNTQNLLCNLKSSLNSSHMHNQPLQYTQLLPAERPETHYVCNFLKAGVYCYGFYLGL